jgi:ubiquinone/menaquinone biosynthesis C-methylase UbiE
MLFPQGFEAFRQLSKDLAKMLRDLSKIPYVQPQAIFNILKTLVDGYKQEYPGVYESTLDQFHKGRGEEIARKFHVVIQNNNLTPTTLLDIGYGDGWFTTSLKNRLGLSKDNVYGVEIQPTPLKATDFNPRIYDGKRIPDDIPRPDLITLNSIYHHFPSRQAIQDHISELFRVLAPGGTLLLRDACLMSPDGVKVGQVRHRLLTNVTGVFPDYMPLDTQYQTMDSWKQLFKDVGFDLKDVEMSVEDPYAPLAFFVLQKPVK